jgi:hypothetical protein
MDATLRTAFDIERDGDRSFLSIPIAHCSESNRIVSVASSIFPSFDSSIPSGFFHEMFLEIEIFSLDGGFEPFTTQDREVAINYIHQIVRPSVIGIVCDSYRRLVLDVRPTTIYRVIKSGSSIEKATRKHVLLSAVIESEGYAAAEAGFDKFGRWFWLMERPRINRG